MAHPNEELSEAERPESTQAERFRLHRREVVEQHKDRPTEAPPPRWCNFTDAVRRASPEYLAVNRRWWPDSALSGLVTALLTCVTTTTIA